MTDYLTEPYTGDMSEPVDIPEGIWRVRFGIASVAKPSDKEKTEAEKTGKEPPLTLLFPLTPVALVDGDIGDFDPADAETEWHRVRLDTKAKAYELQQMLKALGVTGTYPTWLEAARAAEGLEALAALVKEPNKTNPDRPWKTWKNFQPTA